MKKMHLIFAMAAFLLAGAGVFATGLKNLATTYHFSTNSGAICTSATVTKPAACFDVSGPQCLISGTYYSKKVDGNCLIVRQNP